MSVEHDTCHVVQSGVDERDYLSRRADDHRRLAEKSDEPGARLIHERLQRLYEERAACILMVLTD